MIDTIQTVVQPVIVDALLALILAAIAWAARHLPTKWRLDIDKRHRDMLHSALDTGVGYAIDAAQMHPAVAGPDAAIGHVLDYVEASVPDALKHIAPSREHLANMARAKLREALHGDPLTRALEDAGAK